MLERLLTYEEKVILDLRKLYETYGYQPYRMSKFEEYELYIRHKEFLASENVISFSDTNGKVLALKPDVTLSIIKGGVDNPGIKQKVYYNENVYRVSSSTHRYKEIMQAGLECIGDVDLYDIYEVIHLAAASMARVGEDFVICLSHLDTITETIASITSDEDLKEKILYYLSRKNTHDLKRLCDENGIPERGYESLRTFIQAYGKRDSVLEKLGALPATEGLEEIRKLSELIKSSPYSDRIQFDFSLTGNTQYYNGFVFKGMLNGVYGDVLSGGQYDRMMEKMQRRAGAIGFAVYMDVLEQLAERKQGFDVDVLLLYGEGQSPKMVAEKVRELTDKGLSCSAQKNVPEKLRAGEIIDLRKEG